MSQVVLAVALVTAGSGYFMGLRQLDRTHGGAVAGNSQVVQVGTTRVGGEMGVASGESGGIPRIVEYSRLGGGALRPNTTWRSSLVALRRPGPVASTNLTPLGALPVTLAERQLAVRRRAERRAFEGAPPVVPHPVDTTSSANCRVCHLQGLRVREVVAPKMSHPEMGSCTQCHVPQTGPVPTVPGDLFASAPLNGFVGRASAGKGSRAWPGAPPTIPHGTWMRQDCASCHGPTGLEGLRTSHPERALCTQCHVPEEGPDSLVSTPADLAGSVAASALNPAR